MVIMFRGKISILCKGQKSGLCLMSVGHLKKTGVFLDANECNGTTVVSD